jgi:hypothetical protein
VPLRVGHRGDRPSPKPFSSEWILAPLEEEPVREPIELPSWLESERRLLILFIVCITLIIAIGGSGSSSGTSDGEEQPPAVQPQVVQTATTGAVEVQPQSIRGTEPQLPPLPTATVQPTVIGQAPTQ